MANIRNFFKEIKKASRGHKMTSVGIEFGSSSIKIVQFTEEKGVIRLDNYGEISLGPFAGKPDGAVANLNQIQLQSAFDQLLVNVPIEDPEAIAVAIPLSATLVVPIKVSANYPEPTTDDILDEIKEHTPVPLSEVLVDWQEIHGSDELVVPFNQPPESAQGLPSENPEPLDSEDDVDEMDSDQTVSEIVEKPNAPSKNFLSFIVNKEIIDTYTKVVSNAGFAIEYFELEIFSVLRSAVETGTNQAIILDIGAKYTKLYAIKNNEVVLAVKKLFGGSDLTSVFSEYLKTDHPTAESIKRKVIFSDIPNQDLKNQLSASFDSIIKSTQRLREEAGLKVDTPVYLCGGGSLLYGLPDYFAKNLHANIIICQPFLSAESPAFLDKLLVETGPEYSVAAGLALKHLRSI